MQLVIPLENMSVTDKLDALEKIWGDLTRFPETVPMPNWHLDVLRAREARIASGESRFLDIMEAKQAVRDLIR
jgi:hypothetical protein